MGAALLRLREQFELPSAKPAYFALMGGVSAPGILEAVRHAGKLAAQGLGDDDAKLLLRGDWPDRLCGAALLLVIPPSQGAIWKLWKALERGERDALFLAFVARRLDPGFAARAEKTVGKIWRAHVHAHPGEALTERAIQALPELVVCAALVAAMPTSSLRENFAGNAQTARERFLEVAEQALAPA